MKVCKVCRAFEVELLLIKTNDSAPTKAHDRYCSIDTVSDPVSVEDDDAAKATHRFRRAVYPGPCHDVEHRTLDGTRGQLSNDPAHSPLEWAGMLWAIVRIHVLEPDGEYLLAGDEVVISKAGQTTHGYRRFYSSLAQRPINRVSFMAVSLIDVQARRSYPL